MSSKPIVFFIILLFIVVIPIVNAQEISLAQPANQKSVIVVINSSDKIHVKHVITYSSSPKQLELINGTVTNLIVSNDVGNEKQFGTMGNGNTVMIFPSQENTIVEYDLVNVLFLKDNVWTWNFKYTETTSFLIPKEVELLFVNNNPVYLGEKKGINCHGCQMILEYSIDEPKILRNIKLNDKEVLIEIRTFAEIDQLNFEPLSKNINFEVNGKNQFITAVIPLELVPAKYNVFIGDKKIPFNEFNKNATHFWLNIRPDNSGVVSIVSVETISNENTTKENNLSMPVSSTNQNIMIYGLIGVIVLVGFTVAVIIMRKKKSSVTSRKISDDDKPNL